MQPATNFQVTLAHARHQRAGGQSGQFSFVPFAPSASPGALNASSGTNFLHDAAQEWNDVTRRAKELAQTIDAICDFLDPQFNRRQEPRRTLSDRRAGQNPPDGQRRAQSDRRREEDRRQPSPNRLRHLRNELRETLDRKAEIGALLSAS